MTNKTIVALILLVVSGGAAAASPCPRTDVACWRAAVTRSDEDLTARTAEARAAIAGWDGNLGDDDRTAWAARYDEEAAAFSRYAQARCATEISEPRTLACRLRLDGIRSDDLAFRYGLDEAAPPRASVEEAGVPASPAADTEAEEPGSEYGPCADAPPGDCDLCGIAACFDGLTAKARTRMDKALARAAVGKHRDGLLAEQAAWAAFVDLACENQGWETPNRWANSTGVEVIAPCVLAEVTARTRRLRSLAGGR